MTHRRPPRARDGHGHGQLAAGVSECVPVCVCVTGIRNRDIFGSFIHSTLIRQTSSRGSPQAAHASCLLFAVFSAHVYAPQLFLGPIMGMAWP